MVALLGLLTLLTATPAAAHDRLVASSPAEGSTLSAVPATVELTYSAPILPTGAVVQVRDPAGTDRAVGSPTVAGTAVTVAVDPAAPSGAYTVVWRVVSSDGHPIEGTVAFTLAVPAEATPTATPSPAAESTAATDPAPTASATAPPSAGLVGGLSPVVVLAVAVGAIGAVVAAVALGLRRRP